LYVIIIAYKTFVMNSNKIKKYLEGLSEMSLSKILSVLEMVVSLAEIQYQDTYIQDPLVLEKEHYRNAKTSSTEVVLILDNLRKYLDCQVFFKAESRMYLRSGDNSDMRTLKIILNTETFESLRYAYRLSKDVLEKKKVSSVVRMTNEGERLAIILDDYVLFTKGSLKKDGYKIRDKDRKMMLDLLLDSEKKINRDEIATYAMKHLRKLNKEEKKKKVSNNIRSMNKSFQNRLGFVETDKYRLFNKSENHEGYSINRNTFSFEKAPTKRVPASRTK
jgi:hypothetical protein